MTKLMVMEQFDLDARQRAVLGLLAGEEEYILPLFNHYRFIAEQSWPYIMVKVASRIPPEDLSQQAYYELLRILAKRVLGKDKPGLAEVIEYKDYPPCLGLLPYLITSVRQMLRLFSIESSGIIRIKKAVYDSRNICKECEGRGCHECFGTGSRLQPPRCVSNVTFDSGEEHRLTGAIPIQKSHSEQLAIAHEMLTSMRLTIFEKKILWRRVQGVPFHKIATEFNVPIATIYRRFKLIGTKAKRYG